MTIRRNGNVLLAAMSAAIFTQSASAAWLEASSDHFLIYCDTNERYLREFASRLERFDQGLRQIFLSKAPEDDGRRSNRLRIYVVSSVAAVQTLYSRSNSNVWGFYEPRIGGSVAFTPRHAGNGSSADLDAQKVLFHEYAHQFMYTNFTAAYPAWFSEGFAEFSSTAKFEKNGGLSFGLPATHRAYSLFHGNVLDMEQLLDSTAQRVGPIAEEAIYSRGWLLTHYIFFNPDRRRQASIYFEAINQGTPSLAAGKAAFGDLKALDHELDHYLNSGWIKTLPLSAEQLSIGQIDIHPIGLGAAAMMPIHIRSTRGVSREAALALLPKARRLAAPYPQDPVVQVQLAEAEYDADHAEEAEAAADRALKTDPRNIDALLYKGRILVDRAAATHSTDEATWKLARSWFVKANKADPNAALSLFLFYDSFHAAAATPTANSVLGLNRAFELAPEDLGLRLRVAYQALLDKHADFARSALAPIAFDPHASGRRDRAAAAVALIDANKIDEAVKALWSPTKEKQGDDD